MQGTRILRTFVDHRKLPRLVKDASEQPSSSTAADPVHVDSVLLELRALSACSQEFIAVLLSMMQSALQPKPLPPEVTTGVNGGQFVKVLRELQSQYTVLEKFYMEHCLAKAISIDTVLEVRTSLLY